jgi:hypothetical protein
MRLTAGSDGIVEDENLKVDGVEFIESAERQLL